MADVYRVIIKRPEGDQTLTVDQFQKLSPIEQTNLILDNRIAFMDYNGNPISIKDGIQALRKS
jgi:hypothetical protein